MSRESDVDQESRRKFVKTAVYVAPAIVTLSALPSFASAGSGYSRCDDKTGDSGGQYTFSRHRDRYSSFRSYRR